MEKKVTIEYLLSEEGRKQNLLNGGNSEMVQYHTVECTNELLNMIENVIFRSFDWDTTLYVGFGGYDDLGEIESTPWRCVGYDEEYETFDYTYELKYFDTPMTAEQLINWERERLQIIENDKKTF